MNLEIEPYLQEKSTSNHTFLPKLRSSGTIGIDPDIASRRRPGFCIEVLRIWSCRCWGLSFTRKCVSHGYLGRVTEQLRAKRTKIWFARAPKACKFDLRWSRESVGVIIVVMQEGRGWRRAEMRRHFLAFTAVLLLGHLEWSLIRWEIFLSPPSTKLTFTWLEDRANLVGPFMSIG